MNTIIMILSAISIIANIITTVIYSGILYLLIKNEKVHKMYLILAVIAIIIIALTNILEMFI